LVDISILYDRAETDEMGIRLTAEEMGVELGYLPFHKVSVGFGRNGLKYKTINNDYTEALRETKVILNRTQSKNRRIFATVIMDALGKDVVNPLPIEMFCQSKVRTLLAFYRNGVRIPETVYVPCNSVEDGANDLTVDYASVVSDLIIGQLGECGLVLKPDAGTHGRGVTVAIDQESIVESVRSIKPSIINPSGVVAQEFVPKWFYDLRIVVFKEKDHRYRCAPTAMARGGFKDFRTNAHLGNLVFRVDLPESIRREAVRAGEAISGGEEVGVIALDAMPFFGEEKMVNDHELLTYFHDLEKYYEAVTRVKGYPRKLRDFKFYTANVEDAYREYMASEPYGFIDGVIKESLDKVKDSVVFHEGNSCPEFWEQTRIVGGIDVAEYLLRCAVSLIDG
jgi:glutathione synthase/RimK-type ligase-like ATP-grasp enzyme